MKYEDIRHKNLTEQPQKTPNKERSITNASFLPSEVYEYVSGVRKPIGVRVDSGLYSAFKPLSKRIFGSTCNAIEVYMATLILTAKNPASICNTGGMPIKIEKIVIERNLRARRNLEVEEPVDGIRCHYCTKVAVDKFRFLPTGEDFPLCRFHAEGLLCDPKWSVIKSE